jgi:hypothetical protein
MMANWDILNKEFDAILNNISDEEWNDWYNNIDSQKEMCQKQMLLEAKMQSEKIIFNKLFGNLIINETLESKAIVNSSNIQITGNFSESKSTKSKRKTDFPLAA